MSLTECLLPLRAISCRSFSFAEVVAACSQIEFHGLRIAQRTYSNILNMGLAEACKSGEWTRYVDMLNTEVVLGVAAREVSIMKLQNTNASDLQEQSIFKTVLNEFRSTGDGFRERLLAFSEAHCSCSC